MALSLHSTSGYDLIIGLTIGFAIPVIILTLAGFWRSPAPITVNVTSPRLEPVILQKRPLSPINTTTAPSKPPPGSWPEHTVRRRLSEPAISATAHNAHISSSPGSVMSGALPTPPAKCKDEACDHVHDLTSSNAHQTKIQQPGLSQDSATPEARKRWKMHPVGTKPAPHQCVSTTLASMKSPPDRQQMRSAPPAGSKLCTHGCTAGAAPLPIIHQEKGAPVAVPACTCACPKEQKIPRPHSETEEKCNCPCYKQRTKDETVTAPIQPMQVQTAVITKEKKGPPRKQYIERVRGSGTATEWCMKLTS